MKIMNKMIKHFEENESIRLIVVLVFGLLVSTGLILVLKKLVELNLMDKENLFIITMGTFATLFLFVTVCMIGFIIFKMVATPILKKHK